MRSLQARTKQRFDAGVCFSLLVNAFVDFLISPAASALNFSMPIITEERFGERPHAKKVAVIFTDGRSQQDVTTAAESLREAGQFSHVLKAMRHDKALSMWRGNTLERNIDAFRLLLVIYLLVVLEAVIERFSSKPSISTCTLKRTWTKATYCTRTALSSLSWPAMRKMSTWRYDLVPPVSLWTFSLLLCSRRGKV